MSNTKQPTPRGTTKLRAFQALIFFLMFGFASALGAETVEIRFGESGPTPISIGSQLVASWPKAPAGAKLRIALVDEFGKTVTKVETVADIEGIVAPLKLWSRTGVVGCDPEAVLNEFSFRDFADAEALLLGRTFEVQVFDVMSEDLLDSVALRFEAAEELFYFSDAAGCWRGEFFANEAVYLSVHRLRPQLDSMFFFLLEGPFTAPEIGMALEEVRPAFRFEPHLIKVVPGFLSGVLDQIAPPCDLDDAEDQERTYFGVLRPDGKPGSEDLEEDDVVIYAIPLDFSDSDSDGPSEPLTANGVRVNPYERPGGKKC